MDKAAKYSFDVHGEPGHLGPGVPLVQAEGHEDPVVLEVGLVPEAGHQGTVLHLDQVGGDAHDVPPPAPATVLPAHGLVLGPR